MGNQSGKVSSANCILSDKEMKEIHQQILLEYPFLSNVWESMLVTDNNRPDCPIVYANDQFEVMTLYPKEEILGKNCRFLQGKYTDAKLVQRIRQAVDTSQSIDVEILNYRKDGHAFWNSFMILPVHAKGTKTGRATHFIAIQKDVTLLRDVASGDPAKWTPPEVAMWMEKVGYGIYGTAAVERDITGEVLMDLERADLSLLGMVLSTEQKKFMSLVKSLGKPSPERSMSVGAIGDHVPNQREMATAFNEAKSCWSTGPSTKVAVKCFVEGKKEPQLLLVDANATWEEFNHQINKSFGSQQIIYKEDGFRCHVQEESDLRPLLTIAQGRTISLHLENVKVPNDLKMVLKELPLAIIVTNPLGTIQLINREAKALLGYQGTKELQGSHISRVISKMTSVPKKPPPSSEMKVLNKIGGLVSVEVTIRNCGIGYFTFSFIKK